MKRTRTTPPPNRPGTNASPMPATSLSRRSRPTAKSLPTNIGFRLDESTAQLLAERAARLGVSPHELARAYVCDVLQEPAQRHALWQAIGTLQEQLGALRADVALSTVALLASAGQVSETEARQWARRNLQPPNSGTDPG